MFFNTLFCIRVSLVHPDRVAHRDRAASLPRACPALARVSRGRAFSKPSNYVNIVSNTHMIEALQNKIFFG